MKPFNLVSIHGQKSQHSGVTRKLSTFSAVFGEMGELTLDAQRVDVLVNTQKWPIVENENGLWRYPWHRILIAFDAERYVSMNAGVSLKATRSGTECPEPCDRVATADRLDGAFGGFAPSMDRTTDHGPLETGRRPRRVGTLCRRLDDD